MRPCRLSIMVRCWTRSSWNRSEQVTYNLVSDILETGDVVGIKFYPYSQNCCGYTDYLKNHPEKFDAIAAAIDDYSYQSESGSSVDTDDEPDSGNSKLAGFFISTAIDQPAKGRRFKFWRE